MTECIELWRATFETANWTFEAFGYSRNQAWHALKKGWEQHVKQTEAAPGFLEQYAEDVAYDVIRPSCLRDNQVIWEGE